MSTLKRATKQHITPPLLPPSNNDQHSGSSSWFGCAGWSVGRSWSSCHWFQNVGFLVVGLGVGLGVGFFVEGLVVDGLDVDGFDVGLYVGFFVEGLPVDGFDVDGFDVGLDVGFFVDGFFVGLDVGLASQNTLSSGISPQTVVLIQSNP